MSTFEDRLLDELRKFAATGDVPAEVERPRRRSGRDRRALFGLAASVLVAAGIAIGGVPLLADGSSAGAQPFKVIRKDDGRVLFRVIEFRNPKALEQRLRELGVPVVVDYVPVDKQCREPRFREYEMSGHDLTAIFHWEEARPKNGDRLDDAEIAHLVQGWHELVPGLIPPGTTLVLTEGIKEAAEGSGGSTGTYALASGPVGPCELEPRPGHRPSSKDKRDAPYSPGAHHPSTPPATSKP
ncbi:hypothetical protein [Embleya sp. AB8]|uniref:hypothetical protein n=1 Tax=Embleya sp. AB8 TaxID=3156304 RepID=UPI003C76A128